MLDIDQVRNLRRILAEVTLYIRYGKPVSHATEH